MKKLKYEAILLEQFKRDKQTVDNELAVTASKFLNNNKERFIIHELLAGENENTIQ